jgi:antirestriction protein ArdC
MITASDIGKMEFKPYKLKTPWNNIIGEPVQNSSILMFSGPGSGKSTVALQMGDAFTLHGKVGYNAQEEGFSATLQNKLERLGLMNSAINFFECDNIDELKKHVQKEKLDFMIVDSFTMYDKRLVKFEEFRQWCKKQNCVLVAIVQTTKDGKFYGNADAAFNVDCVLKVTDGKPSTLETGKNRLGELYEHEVDLRNKPVKPVLASQVKRSNPEFIRINPNDPEYYGIDVMDPEFLDDNEVRENKGVSPDEIYQMITDRIISTLEKAGELPWHKPWSGSGIGNGLVATNFVSKKPYRGINFFMLNFVMEEGEMVPRKFENPYFLTFKQIQRLKGKLKKGSKGNEVVYFTQLYSYEHEDGSLEIRTYSLDKFQAWLKKNSAKILGSSRRGIRSDGMPVLRKNPTTLKSLMASASNWYVPLLKYYNVFSAEDVTGIDWGELPKNENADLPVFEKIEVAEQIWNSYPGKPALKHKESRAYYSIGSDFINMPPEVSFNSEQEYYSTLFHEAIHSTGAKKRLDRTFGGKFGDPDYAKEELIAELGATFLCAESGILFYTFDNSTAYLQHWKQRLLDKLKDDNRFFFRASSAAQAGTDFILDRNSEGVPAYREKVADLLRPKNSEGLKRKAHNKIIHAFNGYKATAKEHEQLIEELEIARDHKDTKEAESIKKLIDKAFESLGTQTEYFAKLIDTDDLEFAQAVLEESIIGKDLAVKMIENRESKSAQEGQLALFRSNGDPKRELQVLLYAVHDTFFDFSNDMEDLNEATSDLYKEIIGKKNPFKKLTWDDFNLAWKDIFKKAASFSAKKSEKVLDKFGEHWELWLEDVNIEQYADPNYQALPNEPKFRINGKEEALIYLGVCEQIDIDSKYIKGMKGSFVMLTDQTQSTLFIIPPNKVKTVSDVVHDDNAEKLFKQWHNFSADEKDLEISWPDGSPQKIGTASKILYISDKIMRSGDGKGKENYYKHDFDEGKRPVSVLGDMLIVENIKWNERGILN